MACEHALLIEPIAQVVYTNKHPHRELFSVLVVAVYLISFIGFVIHIKTFVSELKTKVDGLKDDNLRLANNIEALAISQLNTEVAELKDDNLRLANKLEFKLEALAISELKMEVAELKTEFATHHHLSRVREGGVLNTSLPRSPQQKVESNGSVW